MYKYIKNPETNKLYDTTSVEGLMLLKSYITQLGGSSPDCNKTGKSKKSCPSEHNIKMIITPKKTAKITQIKGPISLYLWDIICPNNTNKKILLLGDEHTPLDNICIKSDNNCDNIDSFLIKIIKLAQKNNKCIDIFLEEKQKQKSAPIYLKGGKFTKNKQVLQEVKKTFYNCAHHAVSTPMTNKKCGYPNLRFHNFDLRFSNNVPGEHRTSNKLDVLLYNSKDPSGYVHSRDYSLMADYILGVGIKKKDVKRLNKLIKTLLDSAINITTPSYSKKYTVAEIKADMTNFRKSVKKEYLKYLKTKNSYIPRKNRKLRTCLKHIIDQKYNKTKHLGEYTHLFTDLYILSRIFMEFSTDKNKITRSPIKCSIQNNGLKTINISPNKVIIIAGQAHIDVYNQVLDFFYTDSLVYKTPAIKFNKHIKCQDILPKTSDLNEIINKFIE